MFGFYAANSISDYLGSLGTMTDQVSRRVFWSSYQKTTFHPRSQGPQKGKCVQCVEPCLRSNFCAQKWLACSPVVIYMHIKSILMTSENVSLLNWSSDTQDHAGFAAITVCESAPDRPMFRISSLSLATCENSLFAEIAVNCMVFTI